MASSWTLIPSLVSLREEFDALSPDRDKRSDGSIGDPAHAGRSSHHNPDETGNTPYEDSDSKNEVHAIDVDASGPWPSPATFDVLIEELRKRHKDGRDDRLIEIIWNRRRATPESGWAWRDYNGDNAHTEHAHLAGSYNSGRESDTSPWGLVEKWGDDMPSVDDIWNKTFEDPYDTSDNPRQVKARDWLRYVPSDADVKAARDKTDAVDKKVVDLTATVDTMAAQLNRLEQALLGGGNTAAKSTPAPAKATGRGK